MTEPTNKAADPADTFISDIENNLSISSMIDSLERAETALRLSIRLAERAGACAPSANLRGDQLLATLARRDQSYRDKCWPGFHPSERRLCFDA